MAKSVVKGGSTYLSWMSFAIRLMVISSCLEVLSIKLVSPASYASMYCSYTSLGNLASMGRYTTSLPLSFPGSLMANSTNSVAFFRVLTLASYCSGLSICSKRAASWISPKVPLVFTLPNTFFNPPTSSARFFISPSPLCTFSSWVRTSSNDCPMRSFKVF